MLSLQACRESRNFWLPQYFRSPRYIKLSDYGYHPDYLSRDPQGELSWSLRFDVPFISYERDTFAIFDTWTRDQVEFPDTADPDIQIPIFLDPFTGLERARIKHIAMGENAENIAMAVVTLNLPSLPLLRRLSVLSFGIEPNIRQRSTYRGSEMLASHTQHYDSTVFKIPPAISAVHRKFCSDRPRHLFFTPRLHIRRFNSYMAILKAYLWHSAHTNLRPVNVEDVDEIEDFEDFAVSHPRLGSATRTCPLTTIPACGDHGHTARDMLSWVPPFEIDHLLLCENSVVDDFFGDLLD